jgi:flavin reductase (DIM6/NTAB) family NADH-FMN oxidoreductase RutF
MPFDSIKFRRVLGQFATGVTIVTTQRDNRPTGFTANAFCSISLDPPLVLISVGNKNASSQAIKESGYFAINILTSKQQSLAQCFATNGPDKYERFCNVPYHTETTGAPIIDDVLAWVDCRLYAQYPGGDHTIFLGEVLALDSHPGEPLIFANGRYAELTIPAVLLP